MTSTRRRLKKAHYLLFCTYGFSGGFKGFSMKISFKILFQEIVKEVFPISENIK